MWSKLADFTGQLGHQVTEITKQAIYEESLSESDQSFSDGETVTSGTNASASEDEEGEGRVQCYLQDEVSGKSLETAEHELLPLPKCVAGNSNHIVQKNHEIPSRANPLSDQEEVESGDLPQKACFAKEPSQPRLNSIAEVL